MSERANGDVVLKVNETLLNDIPSRDFLFGGMGQPDLFFSLLPAPDFVQNAGPEDQVEPA
jgi:hypothetical protein